jgi:hypothetical protein
VYFIRVQHCNYICFETPFVRMAHPIDRTEEILDWERKKSDYAAAETVKLETQLSLKHDGPDRKPYTLTISTEVPMDDGEYGLEHILTKTLHWFKRHVKKVKVKVEASAGSTSPLKKKRSGTSGPSALTERL